MDWESTLYGNLWWTFYDSYDAVTYLEIIFITELFITQIFTLIPFSQLTYHVPTLPTRANRIHMTIKFVSPLRLKFRCL